MTSLTTVILVNYHSDQLCRAAVRLLRRSDRQILIADNSGTFKHEGDSSNDGGVSVIRPGRNVGFGAACNLALAASLGEVICLHNPDVEPESNLIDELCAGCGSLVRDCWLRHCASRAGCSTTAGLSPTRFANSH